MLMISLVLLRMRKNIALIEKFLRRYENKFHHFEYNEIKSTYVTIWGVESRVAKAFDARLSLTQCRDFLNKLNCWILIEQKLGKNYTTQICPFTRRKFRQVKELNQEMIAKVVSKSHRIPEISKEFISGFSEFEKPSDPEMVKLWIYFVFLGYHTS